MSVYLIHFDRPYRHARHYIGFAIDVYRRIHQHETGNGARLMEVINGAGITWQVARVWWGMDRSFERYLKNRKHASRFCPICQRELQLELPWFGFVPHFELELDWESIQPIAIGG